jgi:hypothetical protein
MSSEIPSVVLQRLVSDDAFCRKTLPHLKGEYFETGAQKLVFSIIDEFTKKYNKAPTPEAIELILSSTEKANDKNASDALRLASTTLVAESDVDRDWLVDQTEAWCKERAVFLAVMEAIGIIDGQKEGVSPGSIPSLLEKALAVSFDNSVGHDYVENAEQRYEFYHQDLERIPFAIDMLNKITRGGVCRKTLNCLIAGTGAGKSLVMCDFAASYLARGLNVLYVTLEMAEERIAERIDANLLDIQIDKLGELSKDVFVNKVKKIGEKSNGHLIVKEYPTSSMHVGHLRALLNELQIKKNFKPDIVFVDYLNIMASSRIKASGAAETYTYCKAIAEELRGLATERDIPIWTATQANRAGNDNSDIELGNTSESFGVPMSLDLFLAIISTEQLQELGQLMFKQLKNRYNDVNFNKRFVVGVNRSKMKLFDVEASAQNLIAQSVKPSAPVAQSPFAAGKGGRSAAIAKLTGLKV